MAETESLCKSLRDIAESMSAGSMWRSSHRKRLRDAADKLATLESANRRLRQALKEDAYEMRDEYWYCCKYCDAKCDPVPADVKHAPDCLAYGGEM